MTVVERYIEELKDLLREWNERGIEYAVFTERRQVIWEAILVEGGSVEKEIREALHGEFRDAIPRTIRYELADRDTSAPSTVRQRRGIDIAAGCGQLALAGGQP